MQDTYVYVVNTETGTKSLCGILPETDDVTAEGQTYRIPCDQKCGNVVELTVRHNEGEGYKKSACILMREVRAFPTGLRKLTLQI